MNELTFYEKPGCVGNLRQKNLLRDLGHRLVVKDLLSEPWTSESLRPFFGTTPVNEWFNLSAPLIKEGWIDIHDLDESQALNLMLKEPLLIRRPLMEMGGLKQSGFVPGPVLDDLGVPLSPEQDLQSCPMGASAPECEVPA